MMINFKDLLLTPQITTSRFEVLYLCSQTIWKTFQDVTHP